MGLISVIPNGDVQRHARPADLRHDGRPDDRLASALFGVLGFLPALLSQFSARNQDDLDQ